MKVGAMMHKGEIYFHLKTSFVVSASSVILMVMFLDDYYDVI